MVPAATKSMLQASVNVRAAGLPSVVIYTTTAGNPETDEGAFALKIFSDAMPFTEHLYDLKNRDELNEILAKSSLNKVIYMEFSYRQLGKTDEWFKDAAARSNGSEDDIARDLLNRWQSASPNSPIKQSIRTILRNNIREPDWVDTTRGLVMLWYVPEEIVTSDSFKEKALIAGMDTSENIGRDFTTLVIEDPNDMSVVAVCRCNNSNTMEVGRYIAELLLQYPRLLWVPERNNTGVAIIDFVIEQLQANNINPYTRIYNEAIQQRDDPNFKERVDVYDYKNIYGHTRALFGYRTSGGAVGGTSRNLLYKTTLVKALELISKRIYDKTLTDELCNLTIRNDRIDHRPGMHDDTVIAFLLSCFLIFFGRNLSFYGIQDNEVLSTITASGDKVSASAKNFQISLQKRIRELEQVLSGNISFVLRQKYQQQLDMLKPLVDTKIIDIKPLAVSQIKSQKSELNGGSNSMQLKAYENRFVQAVNKFDNNDYSRVPANNNYNSFVYGIGYKRPEHIVYQ